MLQCLQRCSFCKIDQQCLKWCAFLSVNGVAPSMVVNQQCLYTGILPMTGSCSVSSVVLPIKLIIVLSFPRQISNGVYSVRCVEAIWDCGGGRGVPRTPRILEGVQVLTKKLTTKIPLSVWFWPSIALFQRYVPYFPWVLTS